MQYVDIQKTLPDAEVDALYEVLRPIAIFEPHAMYFNGDALVYNARDKEPIVCSYAEYGEMERARKANNQPKPASVFYLIEKADKTKAYTWGEALSEDSLTDEDKNFVMAPGLYQNKAFYGLHTYGGYYGFFRPDLTEVANLIHPWWSQLETKPSVMYVTTEPHPGAKAHECYDAEKDKHRAMTTVWWK